MKIAVIGCSAIQRNLTKIYISLLDILYGFQGLQHLIAYAHAMNPQTKEFPKLWRQIRKVFKTKLEENHRKQNKSQLFLLSFPRGTEGPSLCVITGGWRDSTSSQGGPGEPLMPASQRGDTGPEWCLTLSTISPLSRPASPSSARQPGGDNRLETASLS